jgi:peptidoglycan/LPS O-acetylase OafA/YrhL
VSVVRRLMSAPVSRFCGDTAYGFYLVHLLVLLPVAGWLARQPAYVGSPAGVRFVLCFGVVGAIAYPLAWALYRWIEQPGIQLGKALLRRKPVAVA